VGNKEYIERLQMAIEQLHKRPAKHLQTEIVKEAFQGKTVWEGEVEVFELKGHSKTQWCYAWTYKEDDGQEKIATVLQIPPVISPLTAVRVHIAGKK